MSRIGIFGGAFDPPHMGHVTSVAYALATARLDALWVVPCWEHGFGKKMSAFEDRYLMAEAAFNPIFGDRVVVRGVERTWQTKYTVDLIEALRAENPCDTFILIMGQDEYDVIGKWHRADDLRHMVDILPIGRGNYRGDSEFVIPNVSSTKVREMVTDSGTARPKQLVPEPVLRYIDRAGLYRTR